MKQPVALPSLSAAMDGGFTAIADVSAVITTEVPGLAEALRRPAITADVEMVLTDGALLSTTVNLPDAVGMLALKTMVRTVRNETRDAEDLWRCLEVASADGVDSAVFDSTEPLRQVRALLWSELGPNGASLDVLTADLQEDPAARLRTRIRALLAETVGMLPSTG